MLGFKSWRWPDGARWQRTSLSYLWTSIVPGIQLEPRCPLCFQTTRCMLIIRDYQAMPHPSDLRVLSTLMLVIQQLLLLVSSWHGSLATLIKACNVHAGAGEAGAFTWVVGSIVKVLTCIGVIHRLLHYACAWLWAGPIQKTRPEKHHNEAVAERKGMSLSISLSEKKRAT